MRIENIIDDIKNDMMDLRDRLEERLKMENPELKFRVNLPGIEELATVKLVELMIEKEDTQYCFSVQIHTHNGNRVFENESKELVNNQAIPCIARHPFQVRFIHLLRELIKKKKPKKNLSAKARQSTKRNNIY